MRPCRTRGVDKLRGFKSICSHLTSLCYPKNKNIWPSSRESSTRKKIPSIHSLCHRRYVARRLPWQWVSRIVLPNPCRTIKCSYYRPCKKYLLTRMHSASLHRMLRYCPHGWIRRKLHQSTRNRQIRDSTRETNPSMARESIVCKSFASSPLPSLPRRMRLSLPGIRCGFGPSFVPICLTLRRTLARKRNSSMAALLVLLYSD
mmetsp:Transcript_1720/g.3289  ORF Transcript_1720/g.3289 Transcript_1720/m.3289 type:complete len:203 (+) Transcript_1720:631-1239(+)